MSQSVNVGGDESSSTESLTKSELHWLFAEPRSKLTLEALDEVPLPADLDTVATLVTKMESRGEADEQKNVDDVAVSLHHTHLPKMDRLGVISYDPEQKLIE